MALASHLPRLLILVSALACCLPACSLLLSHDSPPTDGGDGWDGGDADRPDADSGPADADESRDDSDLDAPGDGDAGPGDAEREADTWTDADGPGDADQDRDDTPETCSPASTDGTVLALYTFDGRDGADATGRHDGVVVDPAGHVEWPSGPPGCEGAFGLVRPCSDGHVEVGHSSDWDAVAAVDFWVRPGPTRGNDEGLVTRDASGTSRSGHFAASLAVDGRLVVRLQSTSDELRLCSSSPLPEGVWVHVGVNLGEPGAELWVNGVIDHGDGYMSDSDYTIPCEAEVPARPFDIAGNENAWVMGAANWGEAEGSTGVVTHHACGSAIDHVRLSSVRRSFSTLH